MAVQAWHEALLKTFDLGPPTVMLTGVIQELDPAGDFLVLSSFPTICR